MLPRLCSTGTVVCLAPGPSLTTEDCDYVHGKATVIAINDAVRLAPWADVLYSSDRGWWQRNKLARDFAGIRMKVANAEWKTGDAREYPLDESGIVILKNTGVTGVDFMAPGIRNLQNSGGAAINVAVHLGATRILLLGYDMGLQKGRSHFIELGSRPSPYIRFRRLLQTMVAPLEQAGITVLNCSRHTDLEAFPRAVLREVLQ